MYLALVRCNLDDIPIGLYCTPEAARDALRYCTEARFNAVCDVLGIDASGFNHGAIITFDSGTVRRVEIDVPVSQAVQSNCG